MQIAIELPDDLSEQLLELPDMQLFVQEAVKKMLLEQVELTPDDLVIEHTELLQQINNDEILPITRSLVGILKGSNVDEEDYKKHLEEKYL